MQKRKICFVITSLIHYSRNFLILDELNKKKNVELHVVLGGIALSHKYSSHSFNVKKILATDNIKNVHEIHFNLDGDDPMAKAKTVGLGIIEFSSVFNIIKPDLVVLRGDRFEVLSAAIAASHMNIPVAHIEGGDLSGTLDESVRHSITKLSHIHFATNKPAYQRVLRMGEDPKYVFYFGSPDIEIVKRMSQKDFELTSIGIVQTGSGAEIDLSKKYIMVMYHPVNSEIRAIPQQIRNILGAIHELNIQTIWFWPNFDAGAEMISYQLRLFKEKTEDLKIRFMRYLPPKQFLALLSNTKCLIGNSSSGIKECSYLGIPVVNIGTRQNNRLRADNVVDCGHEKKELKKAIRKQIRKGRYPVSKIYFSNDTSKEIAKILATADLYCQKCFKD